METFNKLKQIGFSLGALNFVSALFLWGLTLGITIQRKADSRISPIKLSGSGIDIYADMSFRYCLISLCLLLFIVLFLINSKIFLKVVGLILLAFAISQYSIIFFSKPALPSELGEYSIWLEIIWRMDFFFIISVVVISVLQFYFIWLSNHSSNYYSP